MALVTFARNAAVDLYDVKLSARTGMYVLALDPEVDTGVATGVGVGVGGVVVVGADTTARIAAASVVITARSARTREIMLSWEAVSEVVDGAGKSA
jgi:hypothetical protein